MFHWSVFAVLIQLATEGIALDNGLARTPPMGWISWERFRCNMDCTNYPDTCVSENLYMTMADRMVSDGYRDAGYQYVNIDDCWLAVTRDSKGRLQADKGRFPNGIKALADYMHQRGLKLGIYEDFGTHTCAGFPGSEYYLEADAQTFADWEVDMLKFDGCHSTPKDYSDGYPPMAFWLNKTGRPILFSCEYPLHQIGQGMKPDYPALAKASNLARNSYDIQDSWQSVIEIIEFYGKNDGDFSSVAGPGFFNDPDQLIIGNYGLSYDQQRVQMGMWAIMASPLLMSVDLRTIKPESRALLLNRNIIAINQDPLGIQGNRIKQFDDMQIWTRPISPKGSFAVAYLSTSDRGTPTKVSMTLKQIGLTNHAGYNVTELFDGTYVGILKPTDSLEAMVNPTGIFMAKAKILTPRAS